MKTEEATFKKYGTHGRIMYMDDPDKEVKDMFKDDNDPIYIQEKVDGGNFRIMIKDKQFTFGTKTNEIIEKRDLKIGDLDEEKEREKLQLKFPNKEEEFERMRIKEYLLIWKRACEYIRKKIDLVTCKHDNIIIYAEHILPHSLAYNWNVTPAVIILDIRDLKTGKYIKPDKVKEFCKEYDLEYIDNITITTAKEVREAKYTDDSLPRSKYGDVQMEGFVFKNYEKQIFCKFVAEKFKEVNRKVWGMSKKFAETDDELILAKYLCGNRRIDKKIYELTDRGCELSLCLMKYLPVIVWNDIVEENAVDILKHDYVLNIKQIRKRIAARCLEVLKQRIETANIMNKKEA